MKGSPDQIGNLKKHDYFVDRREEIFHAGWLAELNELKNLEPLPDRHGPESAVGKTSWPK
jgi:hypothetical protein